jgi:hypothetical protein
MHYGTTGNQFGFGTHPTFYDWGWAQCRKPYWKEKNEKDFQYGYMPQFFEIPTLQKLCRS